MTNRASVAENDRVLTVRVPMVLRKRGRRKVVLAPEGTTRTAPGLRIDNAMVKAIARAFRWREMLESGDWAVPRYNGELRLQKPLLPYWLTATSYRLAGVSEAATRLPSVLFGLLSALLLWAWVLAIM